MKLRKEFIVHSINGEILLVPVGGVDCSSLLTGNKTLGEILELLKSETDEPEIVAAMCARYPGAEEAIRRDVKAALDKLRSIRALDE